MNAREGKNELLRKVVALGRELPPALLEGLCRKLEGLSPESSPAEKLRIAQSFVPVGNRSLVGSLLRDWCAKCSNVTPENLAWALRGAAHTDEYYRDRQSAELVWTGPQGELSEFRRTDQALLELINGAVKTLLIATFAAYKIPNIAAAICRAAERGVTISIILESKESSAGRTAFEELKGLGENVAARTSVYVWPVHTRPRDESGHCGALHVKCAVADESVALISSANLTGHAFNLNMELGVLVRGGAMPLQIAEHLRRLIDRGILRKQRW